MEDHEDDLPDQSQYPEVVASVPSHDKIHASINTPRMWTLSLLCALIGSAINLFFSLRYPSVAITPVIALVIVHPLGRLWDTIFKRDSDPVEVFEKGSLVRNSGSSPLYRTRSKKQKLRLFLGQGNWNEKEHACVYIFSNVSFMFAFATDVGAFPISLSQRATYKMIGHRRAIQIL